MGASRLLVPAATSRHHAQSWRKFAVCAVATTALLLMAPAAGATPAALPLVWGARIDGPAHAADAAYFDAASPDGSTVYANGQVTTPSDGLDMVTAAYDAVTGHRKWLATYDGAAHMDDAGQGITVSPDGATVLVIGATYDPSVDYDYLTIAYDAATGAQKWIQRYDGPGHGYDVPISVRTSPSGSRVFLTGSSVGTAQNDDFATIAYDVATGNQAWLARYDAPAHGEDDPGALTVGSNGEVYSMGGSDGVGTGTDVATVAYNPVNGHRLWVARYDGPAHGNDGNCIFTCIETSAAGDRVFVLANEIGVGTSQDIVTLAYDAATGNQLWASPYDGPVSGSDFPGDLAVLPGSGDVVITGAVQTNTHFTDIITIRYAASDGALQWATDFDGPSHGEDYGNTIVANPSGSEVVLAGVSNGDGMNDAAGRDAITQVYDAATGALTGSARFDPAHGQDEGLFLVLSPDGTKAYTAADATPTTNQDFVVLAYRVA